MNEHYGDLLNLTAEIVETARRKHGLTQKELADKLGVIQSTISRIEKGVLAPTLFHWMKMSKILKIPDNALLLGHLDHATTTKIKSGLQEGGYSLPKKYRDLRCFKVRQILPLINFIQEELGREGYIKLVEEMGVKHSFFANLDNQINLNFLMDFFQKLKMFHKINKRTSRGLLKYTADPASHGIISNLYRNADNQIDLIYRHLKNIHKYQKILNITPLTIRKSEITFKAQVEKSLRPFIESIGPVQEEFYWKLFETYLQKLSLFHLKNRPKTTREVKITSTGRDKNFQRKVKISLAA